MIVGQGSARYREPCRTMNTIPPPRRFIPRERGAAIFLRGPLLSTILFMSTRPANPGFQTDRSESAAEWLVLHKQRVLIGVAAIVVLFLGAWFYRSMGQKKAERAESAYFQARQAMSSGNAPLALTDLRNVTMTEADLSGADLRGAKLCGADLSTATLAEALLDGAVADDSTRWPQPETDYSNYGVVRATDPEECE